MKVNIKKLNESAVIPSYSKAGDCGLDLTATSKEIVDKGSYGYIEYGTSLAIELPENFVGLIYPRSSISNTGMIMANSVGVVDAGYRGEIKIRFKAIPDTKQYEIGERVAQLVIMPYPHIEFEEVNELSNTERNEGGFGSTNKKE